MDQLIELLQQIQELAGVGIEALQGAGEAGGGAPEGGEAPAGPPEGGEAPPEEFPPGQ